MALADKYYTIGVLGKSFGVIELMAHQAKWELRDLAKASGLPKGTLQRILLTLCELGFVSQDGKGGAYSLTLKFFKLGQRLQQQPGGESPARLPPAYGKSKRNRQPVCSPKL